MARNKKVEILSNDKEVLHPMTDGDCVIFEDGQTLTQKLSEDDSVKYTPEIVNSSPMFKVGEGNTVDYSDNVLDGAYERATLQGQTYVNYIQESSADEVTLPTPFTEYERTQHNTLTSNEEGTLGINLVGQSYVNALQHDSEEEYVVLGESLEFQEKKVEYTNEGQIKSAMLKGQTLVNLNNGEKNKTLDSTSGDGKLRTYVCNIPYTIPSGTYITFKLKTNTTDGITGNLKAHFKQSANSTTDNDLYLTLRNYQVHPVGEYYVNVCYQTTIDIEAFNIYLDDKTGAIDISDVMILIGDHTNEDIPYFEGMQSVTVSTRLENLCHKYNSELAKNGRTFNANSLADRCVKFVDYKDGAEATYGMKPNTKYLVQFKISNLVLDGLSSLTMAFSVSEPGTTNCLFKDATKTGLITANGIYRVVLTTTDVVSTSGVEIKGIAAEWESTGSTLRSMTISEIMYVEYQNGMENWDLPYFEDYQVMKPVQVESVSKNLIDINNAVKTALCSYTISNNSVTITQTQDAVNGCFVAFPHYLEKGKTYTFSATFNNPQGNNIYIRTAHVDGNNFGQYVGESTTDINGSSTKTFTCENSGIHYMHVYNKVYDAAINVGSVVTWTNIQLEESSTATEYVPHQSKTTYSWDEVILRKVGDVEDTLDLTTGEWVQRIGEIVLNASSSVTSIIDGAYAKIIEVPDKDKENVDNYVSRAICDKCIIRPNIGAKNYDCAIYENPLNYVIFDKTVTSADEFKEKYHGAKFCYPLATPIVHKVNLSRPNLQVYDDITHVHTKCLDGTLIPNIYLPSDISYPAILEPNKKYNVCINHTEVSTDNPLKVNVGGTEITMTDSRMTLTTPATLANSNVSFTGKGNKIKESMLIKNSSLLTRDLPHFNGIGSVQLGKTIENLCSASDFKAGNSDATITWNDNYVHTKISNKAGSCVFVYELAKPLENGKKYFVYSPQTLDNSSCRASFRRVYNNSLSYARQQTVLPKNGKCIIEIDQTDNPYTHICVGCHHEIPLNTEFDLYRPIICEYEPGMENWDWESIGYFTGTKNIGNEFMKVQNKNLFDGLWESGIIIANGELRSSDYGKRTVNYINVKPNTQYTLLATEYTNSLYIHEYDESFNNIQEIQINEGVPTFTTTSNTHYIKFNTHGNIELPNASVCQLEESSTATTYTAHKHNGLYITKDQPIELTWEQGNVNATANTSWNDAIQNTISKRIRTNLITLKPNTSYRVSLGNKNYMWYMYAFDGNNVCPQPHSFNMKPNGFMQTDFIFTTTQQLYKIALVGRKVDDTNITPSEINHIRLEEVTDVVLKGIGNVHDELDITRGIYTQRIGEDVINGNSVTMEWVNFIGGEAGFYGVFIDDFVPYDNSLGEDIRLISDILPSSNTQTQLPYYYEGIATRQMGDEYNRIYLTLAQDKANNLESAKAYLNQNPITIQYILATPIIHKVHIGNKNEANTEVAKPNGVFTLPTLYTEQTHIDLTNNGIMPKVQSRDYIAYPVLPMIDRTYTLQHNLTGGVSNLTVDLLGRTQSVSYQNHKSLVYTPKTMDAILHNELRISGKGKISKVMYIDGGYMDRDIPYIEGMKNAVNPIVKNAGKNLFDKTSTKYIGSWLSSSCAINKLDRIKLYYIPCLPNTTYTISKVLSKYFRAGTTNEIPTTNSTLLQVVIKDSSSEVLQITTVGSAKYLCFNVYDNSQDTLAEQQILDTVMLTQETQNIQYEPYKENICYVDCGEIRLTPDMFEQGGFSGNQDSTYEESKANMAQRYRIKELCKVEPNTTYNIRYTEYDSAVFEYGKDEKKLTLGCNINKSTLTITTSANCHYLAFNFVTSTLPTQHISIIKVSEIKQMRSLPNGVRDELNLQTGEYIQRVGEIVFNGDTKFDDWGERGENGLTFNYYDPQVKQLENEKVSVFADTLLGTNLTTTWGGTPYTVAQADNGNYLQICLNKNDLRENTRDGINDYFLQNPVTVQYELAEPIVKDIIIHNYPHSYEDGHVIIENGDPNTPIPAQLTYRAVTNRSGQIQQHTEQVEKQEREINELETLILANIHLSQTR